MRTPPLESGASGWSECSAVPGGDVYALSASRFRGQIGIISSVRPTKHTVADLLPRCQEGLPSDQRGDEQQREADQRGPLRPEDALSSCSPAAGALGRCVRCRGLVRAGENGGNACAGEKDREHGIGGLGECRRSVSHTLLALPVRGQALLVLPVTNSVTRTPSLTSCTPPRRSPASRSRSRRARPAPPSACEPRPHSCSGRDAPSPAPERAGGECTERETKAADKMSPDHSIHRGFEGGSFIRRGPASRINTRGQHTGRGRGDGSRWVTGSCRSSCGVPSRFSGRNRAERPLGGTLAIAAGERVEERT